MANVLEKVAQYTVESRKVFKKRSYTMRKFIKDIATAMRNLSRFKDINREKRIDPRFGERIMMATTAVNGCRYCSWFHTEMALKSGCSKKEIQEILERDFGSCDENEVLALAFAQHYAETGGKPSRGAIEKLIEFYGVETAKDIMVHIYFITVGNLTGNTIDAFKSRLDGFVVKDGSILFELLVFLIGYPFMRMMENKYEKRE